jgi:hypothetical protein
MTETIVTEPIVEPRDEVIAAVEMTQPIVIDLGKERPKKIKALKKGRGKLWDEVLDVLDEVKVGLGEEADGKTLVPVIMIYRKKYARRRARNFPLFPLP